MNVPGLKEFLQWAVLAKPRRGRRALPVEFTFSDAFLHGLKRILNEELGWKEKHPDFSVRDRAVTDGVDN